MCSEACRENDLSCVLAVLGSYKNDRTSSIKEATIILTYSIMISVETPKRLSLFLKEIIFEKLNIKIIFLAHSVHTKYKTLLS
jgi:hypothetical protein